MSDYSSEDSETEFVLYRNNPEWKDVTPVKQDDGEEPVVAIDYTEAFWQYRREILKGLNKDLNIELDFIHKVILRQSKNYQVWHHRRVLVEWLKDPSKEKYLTELVLAKDAKNYHAWQHRQWVIKTFNLFEGELEYIDSLLLDDVRNNSAWNQRYFVINNTTGFTEEVLNREIDYTLFNTKDVTENESAWNYLRGLLLHDKGGLSKNKKVTEFCENLYKSGNHSPFLLAVLVDMCCEQINEGGGDSVYNLDRARTLCNELITKYDTIRAKYWQYMLDGIEKRPKRARVKRLLRAQIKHMDS
ncbi:hypothetical protein NQ317_002358 [Molorchus minor]|uniref:Protein farnesyltransferase/geranylgeranyltransferase type-1 subunit alpha n=1 Tax=Molorchus minor TaxID=1323400 RepID=A0ABQ9JV04_9CUCU|nr:hypothetical protein NQ317_002358 [Molorchus minor]